MASWSEKRCLYEVLGVSLDCTADEIRSAYRKLAPQRHPEKLVRSGVPESEAKAAFQELLNAYEVLSDARARAWYDSHRSQILFSNSGPTNSSSSGSVPDMFSFFSNSVYSGYSDKVKGFYKVYGDLFQKIYQNDLNFTRKLGTDFPKEALLRMKWFENLRSHVQQTQKVLGDSFHGLSLVDRVTCIYCSWEAKWKSSSNLCDTCGEEFDSRNQLRKHLGSTGLLH